MARKVGILALCRVSATRPRTIEQVMSTFSDKSEATASLAAERDKLHKEGGDPYLVALLPYDRKGGAYLPPSV